MRIESRNVWMKNDSNWMQTSKIKSVTVCIQAKIPTTEQIQMDTVSISMVYQDLFWFSFFLNIE